MFGAKASPKGPHTNHNPPIGRQREWYSLPAHTPIEEINKIGQIEPKNPIEMLENQPRGVLFWPKFITVCVRYYVSNICTKVVQHSLFETISLLVILANCVTLAMDDPTTSVSQPWQIYADYVFQVLYSVELVLKVFAMGFVLQPGAYLRDLWNVLDFIIVIFGYFEYLNIDNGGFDLKPLRIFRVLRPLRTITSVEGLRVLMAALVSSLPDLLDAVVVLLFFLSIFAIAGLQLWHGILTKRCQNITTKEFDTGLVCGYEDCPAGFSCEFYGQNPNYGVTSFDDFFSALFVVFTGVTQEGWTDTQLQLIRAYGYTAPIFFSLLILIGSYFLFNFTLAVIKSRVSKAYEDNRKTQKEKTLGIMRTKPAISSGLGRKRDFSPPIRKRNPGFFLPAMDKKKSTTKKTIEGTGKISKKGTTETWTVEKYKMILGICEMEEDDIVVERRKIVVVPRDAEKVTDDALRIKGQFGKNFKEALKPRPLSKMAPFRTAHVDIPELEDFTDKLFERVSRGIYDHAENVREPTFGNDDDLSPMSPVSPIGKEEDYDVSDIEPNMEPAAPAADSSPVETAKPAPMPLLIRSATRKTTLQLNPTDPEKDKAFTPTGGIGETDPQSPQQPQDEEPDKFVLNVEINVDLTSDKDVLLRTQQGLKIVPNLAPAILVAEVPPYKIKFTYVPTELPTDEPEVPDLPVATEAPSAAVSKPAETIGSKSKKPVSARKRRASLPATRKRTTPRTNPPMNEAKSIASASPRSVKESPRPPPSIPETESRSERSNSLVSSSQTPGTIAKVIPESDEAEKVISVGELLEKMKEELAPDKKPKVPWSGQEVLVNSDPYYAVWATDYLSGIRVWKKGVKGVLAKARYLVKCLMLSEITGGFLTLCVLINTTVLAMNRYGQPTSEASTVQTLNTVFTSLFIAEMGLKLFAIGIVKYLSDAMNYVDGGVVILSLIELIFLDSSQGSSVFRAFQAFRILRTLRVVRMVRLLRVLHSMKLLIKIISETIMSFAYIGMLLLVFLFIYSLLGMQLFGGRFNFDDGTPRQNYDSFHNAFLCVYQVLTIENWQSLQYYSMRAQVPALVALFYVTWLFIGNYVLLNLFLALMLDAFAEEGANGGDDDGSSADVSIFVQRIQQKK